MTSFDDHSTPAATSHRRSPSGRVGTGGTVQTLPTIDSDALFGGAREVVIVHGEERYRLRCTRSGKLLLNK